MGHTRVKKPKSLLIIFKVGIRCPFDGIVNEAIVRVIEDDRGIRVLAESPDDSLVIVQEIKPGEQST